MQIENYNFIQSPLNYTGGKYKLLEQIVPLFPKRIDTFVDLFCGGCNVGININANRIILNDISKMVIKLYKTFQNENIEGIINKIENIIKKYNLSYTRLYKYDKYNCNSSDGLANYNKKGFNKLKKHFNSINDNDNDDYYIILYVLIVYSFNNQIRFNSKGEFNLPVGKRDLNQRMVKKLTDFVNRISDKNKYVFKNLDFNKFDYGNLSKNDFVYVDPPYLITTATYNENGGWTDKDENNLLKVLDYLNSNGIKFALSNVLQSNNRENDILIKWLKNKNYKVNDLLYSYYNSNYQKNNRFANTKEVLITNY